MKQVLDLRGERCPMALLLAKRFIALLNSGEKAEIYVADPSSQRDIERYLDKNNYWVSSNKLNDCCCLDIVSPN